MRKLTIVAATLLTLATAASAHAQAPTPTTGQRPLEFETRQDSMRDKDSVRRDERVIAITTAEMNKMERDAARAKRFDTFKAQVVVTNNSTKAIKSASWSASLIDPDTGQLIRAYDVTTNARIAPGKTKRLSTRLPTPRANVVSANSPSAGKVPVADLKTKITLVTYDDGTTSETP